MSIEENTEQAAYAAVKEVCRMNHRPLERERILKVIIRDIMIFMHWGNVTLKEELPDEVTR